jgi:hypothetical protein
MELKTAAQHTGRHGTPDDAAPEHPMTHDHAGHIDLNEALRNLRNIREGLIEQLRTNDMNMKE